MIAWIGIDVAKFILAVCLVSAGHKPKNKTFPNTPQGLRQLLDWVTKHVNPEEAHFCMESTGVYSLPVASFFAELGLYVSVCNPRPVKHFAVALGLKSKTDKVDAFAIAEFARIRAPRGWQLWDPVRREISQLRARTKQLEKARNAESNRLENVCLPEAVKAQIKDHIQFLKGQEDQMNLAIRDLLGQSKTVETVYEAVTKFKGVGHACGILFASDIDVMAFPNGASIGSFAGLAPRLNESGTYRGQTRITKQGDPALRAVFYSAAVSASRFNPVLKEFYERLRARGLSKKQARVALARKMIIYCWAIARRVLLGQEPTYPGGTCVSRRPWPAKKTTQIEAKT